MTTHPSCGATWPDSALNVSHCSACHVTFSSPSAFDKHRVGGKCKTPEDLGLVQGQRNYDCWSYPPRIDGETKWFEADFDA